jgi:hypothetical protein
MKAMCLSQVPCSTTQESYLLFADVSIDAARISCKN